MTTIRPLSIASRLALLCGLVALASCVRQPPTEPPPPSLVLKPASWDALPGWETGDPAAALPALARSCRRILDKEPMRPLGVLPEAGLYGHWQPACDALLAADPAALRSVLETHFRPWEVRADEDPMGLFTGYYEASLNGARDRGGPYQTPLHARPEDLVMVDLGEFRDHLKGERIAGRVNDGRLRPYEPRADIVAGRWPHDEKVLLWVDDPVEAFFLQIQGSGVVELPDGNRVRVGYAGQNGHPYYAIGRELVKRGHLELEAVSMQSIRDWLAQHPDEAVEIMNTNASYVFFREIEGEGPIGAEGIPLTPGHSLAVDRTRLPYGVPLWLDAEAPGGDGPRLRRLMVAQDTGGAIRGPVRGDVFWGHGPAAEEAAGRMRSQGRYWLLLPRRAAEAPAPAI